MYIKERCACTRTCYNKGCLLSGQGQVLILLIAVRGKFHYTNTQRPVEGFYFPCECNEQYQPVLLPALPEGVFFLMEAKRKLQICGPSLRKAQRHQPLLILSAYIEKNYYMVLSEALRIHLENYFEGLS